MDAPTVRIVRGDPDDTELAAVVAALAAVRAAGRALPATGRRAAARPGPSRRSTFVAATSWRAAR